MRREMSNVRFGLAKEFKKESSGKRKCLHSFRPRRGNNPARSACCFFTASSTNAANTLEFLRLLLDYKL